MADLTVGEALAAARLALLGRVDAPGREAELLLAAALDVPRTALRAWPERAVPPAAARRFDALVARRAAGEPAAYLTGRREFWSLDLEVSSAVLVPRPETELLVELAIAKLADRAAPRVLDLGTGSGAIGLAIAAERPDAQVTLVDASAAALAVAERNRARLALANAACAQGDWYVPVAGRRFDAIVANPPYLAADDPHLPGLAHEPRAALVAGPTGLESLAAIAAGAPDRLAPGGWLLVEHGSTQGAGVRRLLAAAGLEEVATARDLAGLDRVALGRAPTHADGAARG